MLRVIINIGIFLNVFFTSYALSKKPFEFYFSYIPIVILLPIFIIRLKFHTPNLLILLFLLITGLFNIIIGNNEFGNFFKIYANIAINLVFYQYVIQYYDYDIKKIFELYLKGAVIACTIAIIQFVLYNIGLEYFANFRNIIPLNKWGMSKGGFGIRVNGLFGEPSYLAGTIAPAFFCAVYQLVTKNFNYISLYGMLVIISSYVLTASSVAFLGIFVVVIALFLNFGAVRYFFLMIPLVIGGLIYTYRSSIEFKVRMDGLNDLFINNILDDVKARSINKKLYKLQIRNFLRTVNGSSFVFYNNFQITYNNFLDNPLIGTGLGSHEIAFKKYDKSVLIGGFYQNNKADANSTFMRAASELGLVGMFALIFILFKFYITRSKSTENDDYWIISNAIFVLIVLQYLRQGNYTFNAFFLFLWMYYYNYLNHKQHVAELDALNVSDENEKIDALISHQVNNK